MSFLTTNEKNNQFIQGKVLVHTIPYYSCQSIVSNECCDKKDWSQVFQHIEVYWEQCYEPNTTFNLHLEVQMK